MAVRPFRILLAALVLSWAVLSLAAQSPEVGAFAGTVRDEQGKPLAGARIIFRSLDFNLQREVETDKEGHFFHGGLHSGRYHITILRGEQVLWSHPVTLPRFREVLPLEIDLQKLREAAERLMRLSPELEQRREADRVGRERAEQLQRHYNRGNRLLNQGRPEEAIDEFKAALALEPERGSTEALLGMAYAAAGRTDEAREAYQRALALEPREAAHHSNLGALLVRKGKVEEGLARFEKAAQLDPERAALFLFNRGATLLNAGRPTEAVASLRRAIRRDPALAVAHYFLGLALLRTSLPPSEGPDPESIDPRPGTIEAFQRYLQLEPEGKYAEAARTYLEQLGAPPPEVLLPPAPPPDSFD
ncbi:MAG: tetratricopeptide repeat protein [Terriglobia bacterium]